MMGLVTSEPHLRLVEGGPRAAHEPRLDIREEILGLLRAHPQGLEPSAVSRLLGADRATARPLEVSLGLLIVSGQLEAREGLLRLVDGEVRGQRA